MCRCSFRVPAAESRQNRADRRRWPQGVQLSGYDLTGCAQTAAICSPQRRRRCMLPRQTRHPERKPTAAEVHMRRIGVLAVLSAIVVIVISLSTSLMAQVPTGTIAGTVTDQVAAVLPKATVTVTNKDTGAT